MTKEAKWKRWIPAYAGMTNIKLLDKEGKQGARPWPSVPRGENTGRETA